MTSTQLRPTRRTLVRGAAWSVPAISIAAAAPAFAASPCDLRSYVLDWDGGSVTTGTTSWARANYTSGKATVNAPSGSGSAAIGVQFTSVWINEAGWQTRDRRDQAANLTISTETNVGNLSKGRGLYVRHEDPIHGDRDRRQQLTIAFDREVTGLNFTITDIDSTSNLYWDRVEVSALNSVGAAVLHGSTKAPGVIGSGATADPFRQSDADTTFGANQGGGNVGLSFTGSVKSVTLVFWSAAAGGQQAIYLSDMAFQAKGC